jgi:chromosome segregation ATPase
VVLAADAQATIAALQARAEQAERLVASQAQEIIQRRQTLGDLAHLHQEQSKQLTQRTAELEAAKAIQAIDLKNNNAYREQVATLQAELERVRADNKALDEWRADVTVSLQRPGGAFFVDVPQHIKDLVKERDDLRTLLLALPKVEGEILEQGDFAFVRYAHADGPLPEIPRCNQIALLQHRQGME